MIVVECIAAMVALVVTVIAICFWRLAHRTPESTLSLRTTRRLPRMAYRQAVFFSICGSFSERVARSLCCLASLYVVVFYSDPLFEVTSSKLQVAALLEVGVFLCWWS